MLAYESKKNRDYETLHLESNRSMYIFLPSKHLRHKTDHHVCFQIKIGHNNQKKNQNTLMNKTKKKHQGRQ